jgi:hypothetical protein
MIDMLSAHRTNCLRDMEDPKLAADNADKLDPMRAKFLTLKLEPNSTIPKTEKEEPQRMNERRLVDDANSTAWYTERLMKELNLHAP